MTPSTAAPPARHEDRNASELRHVGRPVPRVDAREKVTGQLKYMTDLRFSDPLFGRALRAAHPHARIRRIDTARARAMPGVVCVLTHADVRGLNAFGILFPDQPALAHDKVRMLGDAVALVAAESEELAAAALERIEVDYEPLPVVDDPVAALGPDSATVHEHGNLCHHLRIAEGDAAAAFARAAVVVERTVRTPRQMHAFIETEGGWAVQDPRGTLHIYCPGQAAYRDRMQVARALGLDPERIHIVSNPIGGAFGGKDEITCQIYLALLALHAGGRPVKMHYKREESVVAGMKRHPMIVQMRTAAAADGTLLANQVRIWADTGAYATLGPCVLDVALEGSCGPYRIPHVDLEGWCVYTNNGIAGAFRGFGINQVCVALEANLDEIAERLGLCPLQLRRRNALRRGDRSPTGHPVETSVGIGKCLDALESSELWQNRDRYLAAASAPWKRRGLAVAASLHGCGLGAGSGDHSAASIELLPGGRFRVGCSPQDIGNGNTTTYAQFAADALRCDLAAVRIDQGDTDLAPDGGTVTASRSTYAGGGAILAAAPAMLRLLREAAGEILGLHPDALECRDGRVWSRAGEASAGYAEVYEHLARLGRPRRVEGDFVLPEHAHAVPNSFGLPHYVYGYAAHLALVEVDAFTGETQVVKVVAAIDAGTVVNPQGLEGQSEGGVVMGLGFALMEDTVMAGGRFQTRNFSTYIIPTAGEVPEIETITVPTYEETGPYGAKGVGEVVMIPVCAAIPNAIHHATGAWVDQLPATPERVFRAMAAAARPAREAAARREAAAAGRTSAAARGEAAG